MCSASPAPRRGVALATLVLLGGTMLLARPTRALEVSPVTLHAAILLRAMAYERGLAAASGPLKLAVVRSAPEDDEVVRAFTQLASTLKVANRPLALTVVTLDGTAGRGEALAALRALAPQAIYMPAHQGALMEQVSKAFTESRAILLCADSADMSHGCLLAVEQSGGKSQVVVHLSLAQRLGLRFDGRLLQLARVVSD